jgi:glycine betaine/proline transport system ATP-binding protein
MKKTILFITHDLDEALLLGNRVILMKDGQVIQIGTPEEILTVPANDYVKRFVEKVDKSKVLTAKSVLTPVDVVAYSDDTPQSVFDNMQKNWDIGKGLSCIFVVQRDNTQQGISTKGIRRGGGSSW